MKIAIFGASGFVGSTLVEHIKAHHIGDFVAFVHSAANAWRLTRKDDITIKQIDITDINQVNLALEGFTHVVNCSRGNNEVMLKGLKNIISACHKHNVEKLIHLSSVLVYDDPPPVASTSEIPITKKPRNGYGLVKLKQDNMVKKANANGLPSIILCPPNISGAYSPFLLQLIDAIQTGTMELVDGGNYPCCIVDVENLCSAIVTALRFKENVPERLFITDDSSCSWKDVIDRLTPLLGSDVTIKSIDSNAVRELIAVNELSNKKSFLRSCKHLISSDVRSVLNKDPLIKQVNGMLKNSVCVFGAKVENNLRKIVNEENAGDSSMNNNAGHHLGLLRMQLRNVEHKPEAAKKKIGYQPVFDFDKSMEIFSDWYRATH